MLKIIFLTIISTTALICLIQMFIVSFSNPGFIKPEQRELDKDSQIKMLVATIEDRNILLKYCKTCKIIKDVRVFHCKYCNLCIMRHDHHCPWLSNCIGIKNHKKFLCLILFSIFYSFLNLAILGLIFLKFEAEQANDINNSNPIYHFSTILTKSFDNFYYTSIVIYSSFTILVTFLFLLILFYQIKFISSNETTSENIRRSSNVKNPFNNGFKKNVFQFFNDIEGYKKFTTYNESARDYLMAIMLITEYYAFMDRKSLKASRASITDGENISTIKIDKEYFSHSENSRRTSEKMLDETTDNKY